ncbi:hypothetical protein ABB29_01680 [Pseudoxanthomonas dokdonensis]|uniref:SGNH hydrolase-type esterase domain-containing protein n=2 Tax=Pseudoxanthomonas dokdonensis TaxID=344882 RepID=A0A0R0D2C1_9GAMM|nr:hypothetical protein ABB29_01680 [Pseudoxanthomonas dokdonensis]
MLLVMAGSAMGAGCRAADGIDAATTTVANAAASQSGDAMAPAVASDGRRALAVIGDSDSHSYHDGILLGQGSDGRGGRYHATTWQWTEVLGRLRGDQLDLGEWGTWGEAGLLARTQSALGEEDVRSPRKQDYRYNFAISGYGCDDVIGAPQREFPALARLMDGDPARWADGIVVIRLGVNTFGLQDDLQRLAQDPADPQVLADIDQCLQVIGQGVAMLRGQRPRLDILLVGIFNNAHWAAYTDQWQSAQAIGNIDRGLDRFDDGLKSLAGSDPHIAFFSDRDWFARHWGGRDQRGLPAYHPVRLGRLRVDNSQGDAPTNATLADGHAGTIWNGLWAQALVQALNDDFNAGLRPVTGDEIATLLRPAAD